VLHGTGYYVPGNGSLVMSLVAVVLILMYAMRKVLLGRAGSGVMSRLMLLTSASWLGLSRELVMAVSELACMLSLLEAL
jgi:hypothetical protein